MSLLILLIAKNISCLLKLTENKKIGREKGWFSIDEVEKSLEVLDATNATIKLNC